MVDGEGNPVPARLRDTIFLLLSGVYVSHGTTSALSMRELIRLVTKTPFFHADMKVGAGAGLGGVTGRDTGRTLLDFCVEVRADFIATLVFVLTFGMLYIVDGIVGRIGVRVRLGLGKFMLLEAMLMSLTLLLVVPVIGVGVGVTTAVSASFWLWV